MLFLILETRKFKEFVILVNDEAVAIQVECCICSTIVEAHKMHAHTHTHARTHTHRDRVLNAYLKAA